MGLSTAYFSWNVQAWLDAGWLKLGSVFIDFGAQEFYADAAELRRELDSFLRKHGVAQDRIAAAVGNDMPMVRAIYEALGILYYSVDVDGAHGSAFFDLNSFAPPPYWENTFDFVNNEGTLEHLANPVNGFQVAHEIVKVGGVIRHNFPLIGWREHGFLYPTTKFYAHLCGDNGYEVLKAKAELSESEPFEDAFFKYVIDLNTQCKVAAPQVTNIWGELVYRKTSDRPFVIPVDHVAGPNAAEARERLIAHHRRVAKARIS